MSIKGFNALTRCAAIPPSKLKVLLAYVSHCNNNTYETFVSAGTVAELTGYKSVKHVRKIRREWIKIGVLEEVRPGRGAGNPPTTKICMDWLVANEAEFSKTKKGVSDTALSSEEGCVKSEERGAPRTHKGVQATHPLSMRSINKSIEDSEIQKERKVSEKDRQDLRKTVEEGFLVAYGVSGQGQDESDFDFYRRADKANTKRLKHLGLA